MLDFIREQMQETLRQICSMLPVPTVSVIKFELPKAESNDEELFQILEGQLIKKCGEDDLEYNEFISLLSAFEELRQKKQDRVGRKNFAAWIFWFLMAWMIFVGFLVFLDACDGARLLPFHRVWLIHFGMDEKTLLALLGTTTLNVIGIFAIVANYLFPKKAKEPEEKETPGQRKPASLSLKQSASLIEDNLKEDSEEQADTP